MSDTPLTTDHIAAAEALAGLSFSPEQRELMLTTLSASASPTTRPSARPRWTTAWLRRSTSMSTPPNPPMSHAAIR